MNIVSEGVLAPFEGTGSLWHGTDLLALASMIQSDYMSESIDQDHQNGGSNNGVSCTTNAEMAWSFADRSSYIFADNHNHKELNLGKAPYTGAVVEISVEALRAQGYKMAHYVDHLTFDDDEGDEDEVRVAGRIKPLSSVLVSFSFKPEEVEWFKRWLATDYAKREGAQTVDMLDALLHHPKFRAA